MDYQRVLIEKVRDGDIESKNLMVEFKDYLGIKSIEEIKVINIYDLINASEEEAKKITEEILKEAPIDIIHRGIPIEKGDKAFRVEFLKGQFNQREDSTKYLINLLTGNDDIEVQNSKVIILKGVNDEELEEIKKYYINKIEMKEVPLEFFHYEKEVDTDKSVKILQGFIDLNPKQMEEMKNTHGIGMDMDDLLFCQEYFKTEGRDPSITEIKLIDTYWSDHCRHTTFMTEITDIDIHEGEYKEVFEKALKEYINSREYVYGNISRPISLMDLATINMKEVKKKGLLEDKEDSKEINAASIEIDVDVNGVEERWLLMFKNETHNHPTEMEPFGGAGTCLGGAIRDPLSGRAFVYQAMRISGSGDPRQKFKDTLEGKLPQRKITRTAMEGYSSYGNEIGAATGYIKEVYDEGFIAKRMELGALVAAAPKRGVYRGDAEPGDVIVLVGGRTGRDGLGGAVGSSREHTEESLHTSSAEVQKGNPPIERKILRLFRKEEVSRMIKICNDFGAGGVSVAIGELADGVTVELDKVPLKYPGLDGNEIALSESQERMAVVIDKKDLDRFMKEVEKEDLEGTLVANVTEEKILKMLWRDQEIVNIKRSFLDTNGVRKKMKIQVQSPEKSEDYLDSIPRYLKGKSIKDCFIHNMSLLNTASQKVLAQNFDHSVGGGTVLMPYGGKYELSPAEGMVAKIPVQKGETSTVSIMTYGYEPELLKWSPFHGGYYAVIESIAKIVALGGDYKKVRLTFQEYFERLGEDEEKWGKPFSALLGAYLVQKQLDIPAIGGKDSMSGTFEDLHVPPTLVSFAVAADKMENIVSTEFKEIDSKVLMIPLDINEKGLVDFNILKKNYSKIKELIDKGKILSSSTVKLGGIGRTIAEMSFGNKIGFKFDEINKEELFKPLFGSIVLEVGNKENLEELFGDIDYKVLGSTLNEERIYIGEDKIDLKELIKTWEEPLEEVFPINKKSENDIKDITYNKGNIIKRNIKIAKPKVLIPIFTGTHGEYTLEEAFKKAGGEVETFVFNSLDKNKVQESYKELSKLIKNSQVIAFPDGATLGNEPETGGKLLKLILNNPYIKEAINEHLKIKDGLILGIGNGFQGLIKSGLIENGEVSDIGENSSYIVPNSSGQFISTMVDIKVVSNLSPWMNEMEIGQGYSVPLATKEGKIILGKDEDMIKSGQIATQFVGSNITGSHLGIESLTSPEGRVLGTISSIDRVGEGLYKNIKKTGNHKIFESGIKYFG